MWVVPKQVLQLRKRRESERMQIIALYKEVRRLIPSSEARKTIRPLEDLIGRPNPEFHAICPAGRKGGGDNVRILSTLNNVLGKVLVEITPLLAKGAEWLNQAEFHNDDKEMFAARF